MSYDMPTKRKWTFPILPQITWGNIFTLVIMLITLIWGYAQLTYKVDAIAAGFEQHKRQQEIDVMNYQRRDTQEVRNRFIDQQLSDIKQKLDILIERHDK